MALFIALFEWKPGSRLKTRPNALKVPKKEVVLLF